MELAVLLNDRKYKQPIYALNVVDHESVDERSSEASDKMLERAVYLGSASENKVKKIKRYDINTASGIINVIREKNISDVIMGVNPKAKITDAVFGSMLDVILGSVNRMVYVLSLTQPLSTVSRIVVTATTDAERESGFNRWCYSLATIASQAGAGISIYAPKPVLSAFAREFRHRGRNIKPVLHIQTEFSLDNPLENLASNDLLVVVAARKHSLSYNEGFKSIVSTLPKRVGANSFMVIYPEQFKEGEVDRITEMNGKII